MIAVVRFPKRCEARAEFVAANLRDEGSTLFVEHGAKVRRSPAELIRMLGDGFDVAAYVTQVGTPSPVPRQFNGVGWVNLSTLVIRRTEAAERLLTRWTERNRVARGLEAQNLAISLAEMRDVRFLTLPPEWCWIEALMRPFHPASQPVVEHVIPGSGVYTEIPERPGPQKPEPRPPEVLWVGHLYQYTGYGKANREILFRVANSLTVRIDDTHSEPVCVSEELRTRLDAHRTALVGPKAPLLRLMGPDHISATGRHRIVWTMQETSVRVHPDMVKRANENFDELWTPSRWNLDVFKESGLRLPGRVMPLGVNPLVYRPLKRSPLPPCRLISTGRRGLVASPKGITFLTIGLPGFRKGWDVAADAFELAFAKRRDVNLVIGLTHSPASWNQKVYRQFAKHRVPIWTLEGSFSEHALARIYSSVDAYVSASRGEGFNLPAMEAAACGIPVIVPDNTVHPEFFAPQAFIFRGDGEKVYPEGDWISDWYKGQLFTYFGRRSIRELASILEAVYEGGRAVRTRASALRKKIVSAYTWDRAADAVVERLLEVQP